jgi:hypothetical protein
MRICILSTPWEPVPFDLCPVGALPGTTSEPGSAVGEAA